MARKKKIAKPVIEDMTLTEFRAKLEGIEMFQGDDWCPDAEQWSLIREMINHIVEEEYEVQRVSPYESQLAPQQLGPIQFQQPQMQQPQMQQHSALQLPQVQTYDLPQQSAMPVAPGFDPNLVPAGDIDISQARPFNAPVAPPQHIDTSDGNYESGFV